MTIGALRHGDPTMRPRRIVANVVRHRPWTLIDRLIWSIRQCARIGSRSRCHHRSRHEGVRVSAYFDWWDGTQRRALLLDGDQLIVGSAPGSDVMVGDNSVSRIHAMLRHLNGCWFIEDCGSRNGTSVNGHRIASV